MEVLREMLECRVQEVCQVQPEVLENVDQEESWGNLALLDQLENPVHLEEEGCQDLMVPWDRREKTEAGDKWGLLDPKENLAVLEDLDPLDFKD